MSTTQSSYNIGSSCCAALPWKELSLVLRFSIQYPVGIHSPWSSTWTPEMRLEAAPCRHADNNDNKMSRQIISHKNLNSYKCKRYSKILFRYVACWHIGKWRYSHGYITAYISTRHAADQTSDTQSCCCCGGVELVIVYNTYSVQYRCQLGGERCDGQKVTTFRRSLNFLNQSR